VILCDLHRGAVVSALSRPGGADLSVVWDAVAKSHGTLHADAWCDDPEGDLHPSAARRQRLGEWLSNDAGLRAINRSTDAVAIVASDPLDAETRWETSAGVAAEMRAIAQWGDETPLLLGGPYFSRLPAVLLHRIAQFVSRPAERALSDVVVADYDGAWAGHRQAQDEGLRREGGEGALGASHGSDEAPRETYEAYLWRCLGFDPELGKKGGEEEPPAGLRGCLWAKVRLAQLDPIAVVEHHRARVAQLVGLPEDTRPCEVADALRGLVLGPEKLEAALALLAEVARGEESCSPRSGSGPLGTLASGTLSETQALWRASGRRRLGGGYAPAPARDFPVPLRELEAGLSTTPLSRVGERRPVGAEDVAAWFWGNLDARWAFGAFELEEEHTARCRAPELWVLFERHVRSMIASFIAAFERGPYGTAICASPAQSGKTFAALGWVLYLLSRWRASAAGGRLAVVVCPAGLVRQWAGRARAAGICVKSSADHRAWPPTDRCQLLVLSDRALARYHANGKTADVAARVGALIIDEPRSLWPPRGLPDDCPRLLLDCEPLGARAPRDLAEILPPGVLRRALARARAAAAGPARAASRAAERDLLERLRLCATLLVRERPVAAAAGPREAARAAGPAAAVSRRLAAAIERLAGQLVVRVDPPECARPRVRVREERLYASPGAILQTADDAFQLLLRDKGPRPAMARAVIRFFTDWSGATAVGALLHKEHGSAGCRHVVLIAPEMDDYDFDRLSDRLYQAHRAKAPAGDLGLYRIRRGQDARARETEMHRFRKEPRADSMHVLVASEVACQGYSVGPARVWIHPACLHSPHRARALMSVSGLAPTREALEWTRKLMRGKVRDPEPRGALEVTEFAFAAAATAAKLIAAGSVVEQNRLYYELWDELERDGQGNADLLMLQYAAGYSGDMNQYEFEYE